MTLHTANNQSRHPRHPIPEPLKGSEIGTWTHTSIVKRLPDIAHRILSENNFTESITTKIQQLIEEIPNGLIRPLHDAPAPYFAQWNSYISHQAGKDWLQVPWFFAEYYFYNRILEATGYFFSDTDQGHDPYEFQKQQSMTTSLDNIRSICGQINEWKRKGITDQDILARLIKTSLWANQSDLSLWPVNEQQNTTNHRNHQEGQHLLVDDTHAVSEYLLNGNRAQRIDVLIDNAGFELVCDLALTNHLLNGKIAGVVNLHLKYCPSFVSDAMIKDIKGTIAFLSSDDNPLVQALGNQLQNYVESRKLNLYDDPFWTSPLGLWEMPDHLQQSFAQSNLLISKGDANYRRLLGDRHWPYTTAFSDVVSYLPAPVIAFRVPKSEVVTGLAHGQAEKLNSTDPDWMVNGKWGMIQFSNHSTGSNTKSSP